MQNYVENMWCNMKQFFEKNCFMLAATDNFGNAYKNSSSGRMRAHDTIITLFQMQPDNHIQKPPKGSLDLTNTLNLKKLLCQEIHSSQSSQKLHSVTHFKSKMSSICTKHLKTNLRNVR